MKSMMDARWVLMLGSEFVEVLNDGLPQLYDTRASARKASKAKGYGKPTKVRVVVTPIEGSKG